MHTTKYINLQRKPRPAIILEARDGQSSFALRCVKQNVRI